MKLNFNYFYIFKFYYMFHYLKIYILNYYESLMLTVFVSKDYIPTFISIEINNKNIDYPAANTLTRIFVKICLKLSEVVFNIYFM